MMDRLQSSLIPKIDKKNQASGLGFLLIKTLVHFFNIELFSDFEADLKFFIVVNQGKGIREAIELLDLELVSNMDGMFIQILEDFKAVMNSC